MFFILFFVHDARFEIRVHIKKIDEFFLLFSKLFESQEIFYEAKNFIGNQLSFPLL